LSIKAKLSWIEIARIPKNKTSIEILFLKEALLTNSRTYPTTRLRHPHKTLTNGEDSPLPGGVAKGVGNESPETP
jgi:hypothetical protein